MAFFTTASGLPADVSESALLAVRGSPAGETAKSGLEAILSPSKGPPAVFSTPSGPLGLTFQVASGGAGAFVSAKAARGFRNDYQDAKTPVSTPSRPAGFTFQVASGGAGSFVSAQAVRGLGTVDTPKTGRVGASGDAPAFRPDTLARLRDIFAEDDGARDSATTSGFGFALTAPIPPPVFDLDSPGHPPKSTGFSSGSSEFRSPLPGRSFSTPALGKTKAQPRRIGKGPFCPPRRAFGAPSPLPRAKTMEEDAETSAKRLNDSSRSNQEEGNWRGLRSEDRGRAGIGSEELRDGGAGNDGRWSLHSIHRSQGLSRSERGANGQSIVRNFRMESRQVRVSERREEELAEAVQARMDSTQIGGAEEASTQAQDVQVESDDDENSGPVLYRHLLKANDPADYRHSLSRHNKRELDEYMQRRREDRLEALAQERRQKYLHIVQEEKRLRRLKTRNVISYVDFAIRDVSTPSAHSWTTLRFHGDVRSAVEELVEGRSFRVSGLLVKQQRDASASASLAAVCFESRRSSRSEATPLPKGLQRTALCPPRTPTALPSLRTHFQAFLGLVDVVAVPITWKFKASQMIMYLCDADLNFVTLRMDSSLEEEGLGWESLAGAATWIQDAEFPAQDSLRIPFLVHSRRTLIRTESPPPHLTDAWGRLYAFRKDTPDFVSDAKKKVKLMMYGK